MLKSIKIITVVLIYCLGVVQCHAQTTRMQEMVKNKMKVTWKIEGDLLHISMSAPLQGWVAIGLNTVSELAGTNLIMANVVNGKATVSDRYVVAPGDHRSIAALGADEQATLTDTYENSTGTGISFTLPLSAPDKYHHKLVGGETYYLFMAYSMEDDFEHHSIMRTSVKIRL